MLAGFYSKKNSAEGPKHK